MTCPGQVTPLLVVGERGTFGSHGCSDGPAGLPASFYARTGRATGDSMGQFPWSVQSRDGAHRKQANRHIKRLQVAVSLLSRARVVGEKMKHYPIHSQRVVWRLLCWEDGGEAGQIVEERLRKVGRVSGRGYHRDGSGLYQLVWGTQRRCWSPVDAGQCGVKRVRGCRGAFPCCLATVRRGLRS